MTTSLMRRLEAPCSARQDPVPIAQFYIFGISSGRTQPHGTAVEMTLHHRASSGDRAFGEIHHYSRLPGLLIPMSIKTVAQLSYLYSGNIRLPACRTYQSGPAAKRSLAHRKSDKLLTCNHLSPVLTALPNAVPGIPVRKTCSAEWGENTWVSVVAVTHVLYRQTPL